MTEPDARHLFRVLERQVEIERADGRDMTEHEARALFERLSRDVDLGEHVQFELTPHREEEGHEYPARLSVSGISGIETDAALRALIQPILTDWSPAVRIMGTGSLMQRRSRPAPEPGEDRD